DRAERNGSNRALDSGEVPDPAQQSTERSCGIGPNLEKIAVFTRRIVTFENIWLLAHEFFELLFCRAGSIIGYSNKGQEYLVNRSWINRGEITLNDTFSLETFDPRV